MKVYSLLNNVDRWISNLADKSDLYKKIGEYQVSSTEGNFKAGGRPERWKPLAEGTLEKKYKAGNSQRANKRRTVTRKGKTTKGFSRYAAGNKILIDTGRLKNSIIYRSFYSKVHVGPSGPAVDYAAVHQEGGKRIPARPFLVILDGDRTKIKMMTRIHIRK